MEVIDHNNESKTALHRVIFTFIYIIIILLTISFSSGCQKKPEGAVGASQTKTRAAEKIVRLASPEPISLDPRIAGDRKSQVIIRSLFEGLTRVNQSNKPSLACAKNVTISGDGKVYRFTLKNCTWSTGDPVTSYDFEYAWKSVLSPKFPSAYGYAYYCIKNAYEAKKGKIGLDDVGITCIDDKTLEVTLEYPTPYFLELIANPIYFPVCKKIAEKNCNWAKNSGPNYVSNGPFALKEWKHNAEIILKKNAFYHDQEQVCLDGISFYVVENPQTAMNMFERGDLDLVGDPFMNIPLERISILRQENTLVVRECGGVFYHYLNLNNVVFSSKKMRQAFALAVNRNDITKNLLQGGETPAFSILPNILTLQTKPLFLDHDLIKARELFDQGLAELGLTREAFPLLSISHWSEPRDKAIAESIQQQWQNAFSIKLRLASADFAGHLYKAYTNNFDILGIGWFSWYQDPTYNMEVHKYKTTEMNGAHWEDPKFIQLLDLAKNELNYKKRNEFLQEAEALILDEMPIIPIFNQTYKYQKQPRLKGEYISPVGQLDLKWMYFDNTLENAYLLHNAGQPHFSQTFVKVTQDVFQEWRTGCVNFSHGL